MKASLQHVPPSLGALFHNFVIHTAEVVRACVHVSVLKLVSCIAGAVVVSLEECAVVQGLPCVTLEVP